MRKILALTSIRSDYDLMSRVYSLLATDPEVDLRLLVSGAHLSPFHGNSVENIRADGLTILAEIETLIAADTLSSRLKTAAGLLYASIDVVKTFAPDVIVYAGDREDVLIGAMMGAFLGIPTAHFFGGDHAADGHVDNPVRHATSKLSSLHFVSIGEHKRRLIRLGESEHRIFEIGSVALDKFIQEPFLELEPILNEIEAGPHARCAPLAILIFHPIAEERGVAGAYIENAVHALVERGFHVCLGAPNTDPGNLELIKVLDRVSQKAEVTYYQNLSRPKFINLLRHVKMIVGNSSAGLLEAASLKLPAINIGARQRGRLCGPNVLFTEGDFASIDNAIGQASSTDFQEMLQVLVNPYGDGQSAERAVHLLKSLDLSSFSKKPEDPLTCNE